MDYRKNYQTWLSDPRLSEEGRAELKAIASDEKAKEYRFGGELEFGTAGMRGIIGYGMNMMNVYTVMRATQGLAEFIKELGAEAVKRDAKEDEGKTDQGTGHAVKKGIFDITKTV